MKKITILMVFVAFVSFAMAQTLSVNSEIFTLEPNTDKELTTKMMNKNLSQAKNNAVWTEDFEGEVNWTVFANPDNDMFKWHVFNDTAYKQFCSGYLYLTINQVFHQGG